MTELREPPRELRPHRVRDLRAEIPVEVQKKLSFVFVAALDSSLRHFLPSDVRAVVLKFAGNSSYFEHVAREVREREVCTFELPLGQSLWEFGDLRFAVCSANEVQIWDLPTLTVFSFRGHVYHPKYGYRHTVVCTGATYFAADDNTFRSFEPAKTQKFGDWRLHLESLKRRNETLYTARVGSWEEYLELPDNRGVFLGSKKIKITL
jgi:hypothetical protein